MLTGVQSWLNSLVRPSSPSSRKAGVAGIGPAEICARTHICGFVSNFEQTSLLAEVQAMADQEMS